MTCVFPGTVLRIRSVSDDLSIVDVWDHVYPILSTNKPAFGRNMIYNFLPPPKIDDWQCLLRSSNLYAQHVAYRHLRKADELRKGTGPIPLNLYTQLRLDHPIEKSDDAEFYLTLECARGDDDRSIALPLSYDVVMAIVGELPRLMRWMSICVDEDSAWWKTTMATCRYELR